MVLDVGDPAVLYLVSADQPDLLDLKAVTGESATSRITVRRVRASVGFALELTGIGERIDLTTSTIRCTPRNPQISVQEGESCEFIGVCMCVCVCVCGVCKSQLCLSAILSDFHLILQSFGHPCRWHYHPRRH